MTEFRMPSLGADMEDGTLVEWLKKPGDSLKKGDIVAVVETQKGAIEIESFHDGVLEDTVAEPGTKLPVGAVLAIIRTAGEEAAASPAPAAAKPAVPEVTTPQAAVRPVEMPATGAAARPASARVTPAARREADARHTDLASVAAGPDGIIGLREITSQAATPLPKPGPFDEMRKAIGAAMARSKRDIPHYYITSTIDVSRMVAWLSAHNADRTPPSGFFRWFP